MNWNCVVCGETYALNPANGKYPSGGTLTTPTKTLYLCPDHVNAVVEFIEARKEQAVAASFLTISITSFGCKSR